MRLPKSLQDLASSETVRFLRRPKSITRILSGVFALVVFSSLLTDGYQNTTESPQLHCVLHSNHTACSLAVGAGILTFLSCLVFLALDAHRAHVVNTHLKVVLRLLDIILAVLWAVIWFMGFCFLVNQWHHSSPKEFLMGSASAKAAITFAFFSIFVWIFQAYLAFQDLWSDVAVPYKRCLDESGVVLTTLSPLSTSSSVNMPTSGPTSQTYSSSALSPYTTTLKAPCLAMMPDS
ncbi:Synaptogyrin-4 [Heterocephalus glaber]|uniref:Synaptogyrin n=1 Tax=Heterocephalus glaber TaxID=10181 RepID=G5B8A5_HETGA|nr:synaptogyrin-4 isoform X1 [Heterocephalus glaber]XP_004867073.1 synaptogyrin-4 isoform X1 [Heterocephalus glaber]XP_004867074.1 synaptogyrin-4 isoform X1 [Heterocephalus glaber]XP_021101920.1 synaptogyrin-4 isoform X1 [Heterocephalus glaber]EHB05508.1 Synaptogyrin-4 [Heterocephalus glaber]